MSPEHLCGVVPRHLSELFAITSESVQNTRGGRLGMVGGAQERERFGGRALAVATGSNDWQLRWPAGTLMSRCALAAGHLMD